SDRRTRTHGAVRGAAAASLAHTLAERTASPIAEGGEAGAPRVPGRGDRVPRAALAAVRGPGRRSRGRPVWSGPPVDLGVRCRLPRRGLANGGGQWSRPAVVGPGRGRAAVVRLCTDARGHQVGARGGDPPFSRLC